MNRASAAQALRKMVNGTLAGQSKIATPVARRPRRARVLRRERCLIDMILHLDDEVVWNPATSLTEEPPTTGDPVWALLHPDYPDAGEFCDVWAVSPPDPGPSGTAYGYFPAGSFTFSGSVEWDDVANGNTGVGLRSWAPAIYAQDDGALLSIGVVSAPAGAGNTIVVLSPSTITVSEPWWFVLILEADNGPSPLPNPWNVVKPDSYVRIQEA